MQHYFAYLTTMKQVVFPIVDKCPRCSSFQLCIQHNLSWNNQLAQTLLLWDTINQYFVYTLCRVYKPRVPQGPASTPGLGPREQHVIHGAAQESKTQRAGRTVRSPTKRSTQKNKRSLVNFFGPPLRPKHSLRAPAASRWSLQSEGLAQNAASYSDPASLTGEP